MQAKKKVTMSTQMPHMEVIQSEQDGNVNVFFGMILESIGVCKAGEVADKSFPASFLNRQVDFLAALPALGDGNAIERTHST